MEKYSPITAGDGVFHFQAFCSVYLAKTLKANDCCNFRVQADRGDPSNGGNGSEIKY